MSLINTQVVPFKVQAYHNGKFVEVTDADLRGHWSVFVFYPADFTFVCPTELEDLADLYDEFKKINCEIYSVSTDTHFTHKAWAEASPAIKKVRYPMLGDPAQKLARAFDVLIEEEGMVTRRGEQRVRPQTGEVAAADAELEFGFDGHDRSWYLR